MSAKVKVKMKKTAANPGNIYEAGKVYEIDEETAKQFVDGEACEILAGDAAAAAKVTRTEKIKEPVKKDAGK